ncbi:MAG: ABC transporter permease [Candidatus Bathyarchaeia archaeon]
MKFITGVDFSQFGLSFGVFMIFILALAFVPRFRTLDNIYSLIVRTVPLFSVALGQSFTMLVGCIDLSIGSLVSLVTAIASIFMASSMVLAVSLCAVAVLLFSALNGAAVAIARLNPFVGTLATMYIAKGITLYIRPQPGGFIPRNYIAFMLAEIKGFPIAPLVWLIALVFIAWFIAFKTRLGRNLYAIGGAPEIAALAGINIVRGQILAYLFCGLFTVFAGLFLAARIGCGDPAVGDPLLLDSVGAAVLGGTLLTGGRFTPWTVLGGGFLFGLINNIFNLIGINIYWQYIFKGAIIIFLVGISYLWQLQITRKARLL